MVREMSLLFGTSLRMSKLVLISDSDSSESINPSGGIAVSMLWCKWKSLNERILRLFQFVGRNR